MTQRGSDRPASHFEDESGSGFFQGSLSASDQDTAGGADNERTARTPVTRKATRQMTQPRGKHRK